MDSAVVSGTGESTTRFATGRCYVLSSHFISNLFSIFDLFAYFSSLSFTVRFFFSRSSLFFRRYYRIRDWVLEAIQRRVSGILVEFWSEVAGIMGTVRVRVIVKIGVWVGEMKWENDCYEFQLNRGPFALIEIG